MEESQSDLEEQELTPNQPDQLPPSNHNKLPLHRSIQDTDKTQPTHLANTNSLISQNLRLKRQNQILAHDLQQLSTRLEFELSKHTNPQQLSNNLKLLELYKREIKSLRRQVLSSPQRKLIELQSVLKCKDSEIQSLKSEIKGLKKLNAYQQKGLVQAAGQGVIDSLQKHQHLNEQHRKLLKKCEDYERQLRRKSVAKVIQVHASEDLQQIEEFERQVEVLKIVEMKNKKQIYNLMREVEKLREERGRFVEDLRVKDKELQKSNYRVMEIRKFIKPKRVQQRDLEQNSYHNPRAKTFPDQPLTTTTPPPPPPQPSSIFKHPSSIAARYSIPRNYRQAYPKVQCRGQSLPNSKPWNDTKYSSKILQVKLSIDPQNKINSLHCRYLKGQPGKLFANYEYSSFKCREGEYIHLISGGFSSGMLDFIVFVTNQKRKIKFGVESRSTNKFDFNIEEYEYPCAMFGEVTEVQGGAAGWRINKIGCLIERL